MFAFALSCPHQNAAVKWVPQHNQFECTKHDSHYTADGTHVSGRATRNMDRFPIRKDGNMVHVDTEHVFESDKDAAGWNARDGHGMMPWPAAARRGCAPRARGRVPGTAAGTYDGGTSTSTSPTVADDADTTDRSGNADDAGAGAGRPHLHHRHRADHERRLRPRATGPSVHDGGYNLSTYAGVMRAVTAGSASSMLVRVTQSNGIMYGELSGTARRRRRPSTTGS